MQTILRFFRTVVDSACKPRTYGAHVKERTSAGLGYLYWLLVCTSTVTSIVLALLYVPTRPDIQEFFAKTGPALKNVYPAELVLDIQSGALSTNVDEPYIIDPEFWPTLRDSADGTSSFTTHFLTIDTNASIDDFESYDTAILATRTHVVYKRDDGIRANPFSEMKEHVVVDKEMFDNTIDAAIPFLEAAPLWIDRGVVAGLLLLPFVGAGFAWAWYLFILLIWSLLAWAISGMMGRKLTYGQIYRLGLYGVTLPILLGLLVQLTPAASRPLLPTVIFLVFMGLVFKYIPRPIMHAAQVARKPRKVVKKAVKSKKKAKDLA